MNKSKIFCTIKKSSPKYLVFIGLQSLIFTFLYNSHLLDAPGWGQLICPFFAFTSILMGFYLLYLWMPLATIAVPIIYILSSIGSYYYNLYKIDINHSSIAFVFETHYFEAVEFITWSNTLWVILSLLLAVFWLVFIKYKSIKRPHYSFSIFFLLLLVGINFGIFDAKWYRNAFPEIASPMRYHKIFPVNVVKGIKGYYSELSKIEAMGPLVDCAGSPSRRMFSDDLTMILILGESARADHFQINGYPRSTNPRLINEQNLISFPKTVSFAACTRYSVPIIITPADSTRPENRYSSFIDIFKKHGYETFWLSLNDSLGTANNPTTRLLQTVDNAVFRESLHIDYDLASDDILFPLLTSAIDDQASSKAIVLHTRGSHYDYHKRYGEKSRKFIPDLPGDHDIPKHEITINAYDNSIVATDAFISEVIERVRGMNAVVIYISDHGESLGEEGYYHHGNPKRVEQRIVPFLIWCSDSYIQRHEDVFRNLEKNACLQVSHDYIFPTMLGLAGITSQLKRNELDLTTNSPLPDSGTAGISFPPGILKTCKSEHTQTDPQ